MNAANFISDVTKAIQDMTYKFKDFDIESLDSGKTISLSFNEEDKHKFELQVMKEGFSVKKVILYYSINQEKAVAIDLEIKFSLVGLTVESIETAICSCIHFFFSANGW